MIYRRLEYLWAYLCIVKLTLHKAGSRQSHGGRPLHAPGHKMMWDAQFLSLWVSSPEKSKNVLETVVVKPNLCVRVDPRAALVSKNILPLVGIEVRPPSSQAPW